MTPRNDPTPRDRPFPLDSLAPGDQELIRARQLGRARVMALLLGGFVLLVFFITIAKLRHGHS